MGDHIRFYFGYIYACRPLLDLNKPKTLSIIIEFIVLNYVNLLCVQIALPCKPLPGGLWQASSTFYLELTNLCSSAENQAVRTTAYDCLCFSFE